MVQPYKVRLPTPNSALTVSAAGSQAGVGQGVNEVWISKNKAETPFKGYHPMDHFFPLKVDGIPALPASWGDCETVMR